MGVFPEDEEIEVRLLIRLWVAEGFIKPIDAKSLEEAGEEYLEEVIGRNLVLVEKLDHCGDVETFKMHDLMRDLALREGEKHRFLYSLSSSSRIDDREISQGIIIGTAASFDEENTLVEESLEGADASSLAVPRTLMGNFPAHTLSISSFRLLRVCLVRLFDDGDEESSDEYYEHIFFIPLLKLRFLFVTVLDHPLSKFVSSSVSFHWNLQTLILPDHIDDDDDDDDYVLDIWKMPLLRVVITNTSLCLPDPPADDDEVALENLHTLSTVRNLNLGEGVLTRIPNIRILDLFYKEEEEEEEEVDYCLNINLHRLSNLQDLRLGRDSWDSRPYYKMQELILPYSLKKLTLYNTKLPWEEMASKIGCLPRLQVLKLEYNALIGSNWETVEGQFSTLKYLEIGNCDLEYWITDDNTHFPRVEHFVLRYLQRLREIPSSIGDIPTLRLIELESCSDYVEESARRIVEEQEEMGNQDIQLQVIK